MDKTVTLIAILILGSFIVSKVQCWSNLEILEKQKPGVQPFEGHKVIRAFPRTKVDIDYLNSLEENPDIEVDFWSRSRNIDIHVTPEDYKKLDAYLQRWKINYKVINNNLQKSVEEEEKGHYRQVHGWHGQYHNYDEIIQKINNLDTNSPLAQVVDIGKSYEDKEIKGLEISDGKVGNENKQKIVTVCGQHAREWISPATCMYIMENMIQNYEKEANVTLMLNRFNWVFIPIMNPDGYVFTWDKTNGDRLWRKNRQPNGKSACHGIDLNRNWGFKFAGSGSSNEPCSDIYRGSAAFSAPEVRAVADYITANKDKVYCFLDIHSYSQLMMYPWSYSKAVVAKDKNELHRVSEETVKALRSVHNTDFKTGAAAVIIYEAAGSGKDWVYGSVGVKYAFVFELRDTGKSGFMLPQDQIIPTGEETLAAFHSLAASMKDYDNKRTNF